MSSPASSATPLPPAPAPRRRRWLRIGLICGGVVVLVPVVIYFAASMWTANAWAEAEAEAARDDPRWRLADIEADRKQIPDHENSALHCIATIAMAPGFGFDDGRNHYEKIFDKLPANAQLNAQQEQLIRRRSALNPKAIEEARKLKDMPYGRYPMVYRDDWITTPLNRQQETRRFADWLPNDAVLLAQEGQPDEAVESCQALLNAARSIGDEPLLISFLIRVAITNISVGTLERVLAQGEPSEKTLAAMQTLLEKDIEESTWLHGVRGDRAGQHQLFENMRSGKVDAKILAAYGPIRAGQPGFSGVASEALFNVFPRTILNSYPEHLKHVNRVVAAAKLPHHERAAKLLELEAEARAAGNPATATLGSSWAKLGKADARNQIYLRTAVLMVACERYRLADKDGRWPETLGDLTRARLLDKVPLDPLHNEPFHYRRTKDFIVIYSIGFDGKDDGGNIDRDRPNEPGVDLGFRVWNLDRRRQAPPPIVAVE